jgi:hypothetical protein
MKKSAEFPALLQSFFRSPQESGRPLEFTRFRFFGFRVWFWSGIVNPAAVPCGNVL